jgi:hypothetical protein
VLPGAMHAHTRAAVVAARALVVALAQLVHDAGAGCLGAANVDVLVPAKVNAITMR